MVTDRDADRTRTPVLPITDDDATIAAALEDVSIPTLMLSMVHMTGDPSIIRRPTCGRRASSSTRSRAS